MSFQSYLTRLTTKWNNGIQFNSIQFNSIQSIRKYFGRDGRVVRWRIENNKGETLGSFPLLAMSDSAYKYRAPQRPTISGKGLEHTVSKVGKATFGTSTDSGIWYLKGKASLPSSLSLVTHHTYFGFLRGISEKVQASLPYVSSIKVSLLSDKYY